MKSFEKYLPYILILILFTTGFCLLYFNFVSHNGKYLKVVFLDVGQGDSIYIEAPNGTQMLVDAGKDQSVLVDLAKVMPFGDRSLNMLVATHADSDHIGGFSSVLDFYTVDGILENGATSNTKTYQELEDRVLNKNIKKFIARTGMKIILDKEKNIYFEVLFPDQDVSSWDTNDGSIVGKLIYGNESFMLTGDASVYSEILMHQKERELLKANVLKLGHHGSKTSSSVLWLEDVRPDLAIISAGKDNSYGHPNQEILDRLANMKIPYLSTIDKGNIIFKTDGVRLIY